MSAAENETSTNGSFMAAQRRQSFLFLHAEAELPVPDTFLMLDPLMETIPLPMARARDMGKLEF